MQIVDFDAERRRAEQYSDISRSACALTVIALVLVTAFAMLMFWPS